MKRIYTLLLASMIAVCTLSAQESTHFSFKQIPIDGPTTAFGQQLVAQGFQKVGNNAYRGSFLRNDCLVALVSDEDNMIWRVAAIFPATDMWNTLESSFNGYIDLYSEKYGKPSATEREFLGYAPDNYFKMRCLENGECNYFALWNLPQGSIEIRIVKGNDDKEGAVRIVYTDNANKESVRKADLEDI